MMCFVRFIELILHLDTETFEEQLDRNLHKSNSMYEVDVGYADESLIDHGIGVAYHNDSKRKKIKFVVYCPSLAIDDDNGDEAWEPTPGNTKRLLKRLDKLIVKYFNSTHHISFPKEYLDSIITDRFKQ